MRSVWRYAILGFALATFALSTTGALAQSKEPVGLGTWKLNVEKSKYSPGPAPKSLTVKFEAAGKGVKVTTEGVGADGKPTGTEYTGEYDGKDYPIKGSPNSDTVSLRRISDTSTERIDKKAGKPVLTYTRVVAKDGKSFTVTIKGTNSKGEPVNNVLVFDKQ